MVWFVFWHDLYHSNLALPLIRQNADILDDRFKGSLPYRPTPRAELEQLLERRELRCVPAEALDALYGSLRRIVLADGGLLLGKGGEAANDDGLVMGFAGVVGAVVRGKNEEEGEEEDDGQ